MSGKPDAQNQPSLAEQLSAMGLRPLGDPRHPVFKGDVVAAPAPETLASLPITVSEKHFHVNPGSGEVLAKGYGLIELADGELRIRPQLRIVDERTAIRAVVHAADFLGRPVIPRRLAEVLLRMGVCAEPALDEIRHSLEQARETGKPVRDVIIARGVPPRPGTDGGYEIFEAKGAVHEHDQRIDYRQRSTFHKVSEGEVIGRIIPPVPGEGGMDVFGNVIPCPEPKTVQPSLGDGVVISEDGLQIVATQAGLLSTSGDRLTVLDGVDIPGDVDFSTGNVHLERGSVVIRGSIKDGFTVDVPGNVAVGDTINAATVRAGGDVLVALGVLTGENGEVAAAGAVTAQFMENSRVFAGGDVTVAQNITNCTVRAGGKVVCTRGKGVILGGEIEALRGVEARELGSEYGVKTQINLGPRLAAIERDEVLRQKADVKVTLGKIERVLGPGDPRSILERTAPVDRQRVAQLLKIRISAEAQLTELDCLLTQERDCARQCGEVKLRVRGTIHPGVSVTVLGRTLHVEEPLSFATIGFDPETMTITVS